MSDILAAAQAVVGDAQKPVRVFADIPGDDVPLFGETVHGALLRACRNATDTERDAVLRTLLPALQTGGSFAFNVVAIVCGTIVEWGGDPLIAVFALLDRLPEHVRLATLAWRREDGETPEQAFQKQPEVYGAARALQYSLLATMAMICRSPAARQYARTVPGLADALIELLELEPYVPEADFLLQTLALTDGMELVVIHAESRRGFRVALEAIGSNFHLFTLLQNAVISDSLRGFSPVGLPDPAIIAIAKGESPISEDAYDTARFQFYNWFALSPDGTIDGTNIAAWIWGEGSPADIAPLDGERIVLLGSPVLAVRSWQGFFLNIHTALRSDVRVTAILSDAEVTDYLTASRRRRLRSERFAPAVGIYYYE